jgi:serine/threonine-protein kinase
MTASLDADPGELAIAADKTLSARADACAFDETIGVLAATALTGHPSRPKLGPRSVDARSLPFLAANIDSPDRDGDFIIKRTLGQGGMGLVELAEQRSLQREVAIKRARNDGPETHCAALLAEAVYTGYLEHPSIVPVHQLGRDASDRPVMVMKKIEGATLEDVLRDPAHTLFSRSGGDRLAFFVDVGRKLADALAYAHDRGVVHRDIKPANVMLGRFGEVYLLDWGIATRVGEKLEEGAIAGSLSYMAPEMLRPEAGDIGPATDVYLLAATLHQCLTGSPPHTGPDRMAVLESIAHSAPRTYSVDVPDELAETLRRAMHRDPEQRFASAELFGEALAGFEAHRAASALGRVAEARLAELRALVANGAPQRDVHVVFYECRFGFEQSLRAYPAAKDSVRGLADALVTMAGFELRERNLHAAEALLARLDSPPPELVGKLEALRVELDLEHGDRERLKRIEHDMDDNVGRTERTIVARSALVLLVLVGTTIGVLRGLGLFAPGPRVMTFSMIPGGVMLFGVLYVFRARLLANLRSRQIACTLVVLYLVLTTNRTIGALAGRSFSDVATGDAMIFCAVAASAALTLRRVYLVAAVVFWAAALVIQHLSDRAVFALGGAAMVSAFAIVAAPRRFSEPLLTGPGGSREREQHPRSERL